MARKLKWKPERKLDLNADLHEKKLAASHEDMVLGFLDKHRQQEAEREQQASLQRQRAQSRSRRDLAKVYYTWPKRGPVGPKEIAYHVSTKRPAWWSISQTDRSK